MADVTEGRSGTDSGAIGCTQSTRRDSGPAPTAFVAVTLTV
jgi:hypothetical protein